MANEKVKDKGKDFLKVLEDRFNAYFEPDVFRTGIIPLDLVLNGGLETGSLIELSGESQSGKSTLILHLVKNMAESGYKTLYIDSEGSVKEDMIRGIGLGPFLATKKNKNNLFTVVRESGYKGVEDLIDAALQTNEYKLFVIDSLSALANDEYLDVSSDRSATEMRIGLDAQLTSRLLKKLNALKTEHNCIFIIINQTRVDLSNTFKPTYSSTGGQAVKFYPDIRLFMRVVSKIKEKRALIVGEQEIPIGANCTIEARKSRLGAGNIPYPLVVYYGKGISSLAAYESLLPRVIIKKKPVLERTSTVSYLLRLPSGEYKTSKGEAGLHTLVAEHFDELTKIMDEYLDDYFKKVEKDELKISDEIVEDVEANSISLDDTLNDSISLE